MLGSGKSTCCLSLPVSVQQRTGGEPRSLLLLIPPIFQYYFGLFFSFHLLIWFFWKKSILFISPPPRLYSIPILDLPVETSSQPDGFVIRTLRKKVIENKSVLDFLRVPALLSAATIRCRFDLLCCRKPSWQFELWSRHKTRELTARDPFSLPLSLCAVRHTSELANVSSHHTQGEWTLCRSIRAAHTVGRQLHVIFCFSSFLQTTIDSVSSLFLSFSFSYSSLTFSGLVSVSLNFFFEWGGGRDLFMLLSFLLDIFLPHRIPSWHAWIPARNFEHVFVPSSSSSSSSLNNTKGRSVSSLFWAR